MMTKPILLTLASSLFFFSGCAAKNRWFSRKDYSEMQDPFMESDALANKGREESVGRSKLGGLVSKSPTESESDARSRSVQQTGADDEGVARSGRVSNASFPERTAAVPGQMASDSPAVRSYTGPALSDFLSKKQTATVNGAVTSANETATAAVNLPGTLKARAAQSPAARAAALPDLNEEAAGFNNFLKEKSNAVTQAARSTASTVEESEESVEDFASWAKQEQQRYRQEASEVASAANSAPVAAQQQVKSSAKQARRVVDEAVEDFNTPAFEDDTTAEPLMKEYEAPEFEAEVPTRNVQKSAASVEENPFDNAFEAGEFEPAPVTPKKSTSAPRASTTSKSTRKGLDDSFQMDSGWKPSHLSHD